MVEYYRQYLKYCTEQRCLSHHSIRAYEQDLNCYYKWLVGLKETLQSEETKLIEFHRHLRMETQSSPATNRRRIVTLKAFFKWQAREVEAAPPDFSKLDIDLSVPRRLPRPVDRETLINLLRDSPRITPRFSSVDLPADVGQTTSLAVRLLIATGIRIGELVRVRVSDALGKSGKLRIHGKGNRERFVYVTNQHLLADLNSYAAARAAISDVDAPLLLNSRGSALTEAAFRKRLRRVSLQLDLPSHLTPHQFRHSAATMLIEEGVDIRFVQRLLGHASITTTEIYTKVSDVSLLREIQRADTLATVDDK